MLVFLSKYHQREESYGKIMSFQVLSLWLYGVSDPVLIQEVYTQLQKFQTRGKNGIAYFIPNSLLGLENCDQLWKQHRNIIVGAFTESYLRKYSNEIISVGKQLEANLMKDGLVKNINDLMGEVAYQVVSQLILFINWTYAFIGVSKHCHGQGLAERLPECRKQGRAGCCSFHRELIDPLS